MSERTNLGVKEELLGVAKEMLDCGLVDGTAGNLSARLPDGNVVLTPSSLDYRTMTLDDLVVCDLDGTVVEGTRGPTTEKALHLGALARTPTSTPPCTATPSTARCSRSRASRSPR